MCRNASKRIFGHVRPAKIQISLHILAVWSEHPLGAFWIYKTATSLWVDSVDSEQTVRMRRLIWAFVGRIYQKVRFLTVKLVCRLLI